MVVVEAEVVEAGVIIFVVAALVVRCEVEEVASADLLLVLLVVDLRFESTDLVDFDDGFDGDLIGVDDEEIGMLEAEIAEVGELEAAVESTILAGVIEAAVDRDDASNKAVCEGICIVGDDTIEFERCAVVGGVERILQESVAIVGLDDESAEDG